MELGTVGNALAKSNPLLGGLPSPGEAAASPDTSDSGNSSNYNASGLRDVLGRNKEQINALQGRLKTLDDQSDALKPPEMVKAPPPPETKDTPVSERWGSVAMMLAGFGGLLTRQPLTASLNAMAAVNHAYNEGDAAKAKSAFDTWKVENENAIKMNEFHVKAYESAIRKIATDRAGSLAEIRATAAALKDDVVISLLDSGQTDRALGVLGARPVATQQLSDRAEKIADQHAGMDYWDQQHPDANPQQRGVAHAAIRAGKDPDDPSKEFSKGAPTQLEITGEDGTKKTIYADRDLRTGGWRTADENRTPIEAGADGGFKIVKGQSHAPTVGNMDAAAIQALVDKGMPYEEAKRQVMLRPESLTQMDADAVRQRMQDNPGMSEPEARKQVQTERTPDKPLSAAQAQRGDLETRAKARADALRAQGQEVTPAQEAQIRADITAEDGAKRSQLVAEAKARAAPKKVVLNTEAADMEAKQFLLTGNMPALGFGSDARVQILNRAAEIAAEQGHTIEDYLAGRASWKADTASLGQITKIADAVAGFENTAIENMKVAESLMNKGAGTSAGPVVNRWLQAGRVATGDPDVAAFNTAMGTVASEYGKIISGGSASIAATPEGAREEAKEWLDKVQSTDAIKAQFAVARRDMTNRKNSLFERREAIQGRIRHPDVGVSGGGAPAHKEGDQTKSKSGRDIIFQGGQWQYSQ